jgi:hypothetical protein
MIIFVMLTAHSLTAHSSEHRGVDVSGNATMLSVDNDTMCQWGGYPPEFRAGGAAAARPGRRDLVELGGRRARQALPGRLRPLNPPPNRKQSSRCQQSARGLVGVGLGVGTTGANSSGYPLRVTTHSPVPDVELMFG